MGGAGFQTDLRRWHVRQVRPQGFVPEWRLPHDWHGPSHIDRPHARAHLDHVSWLRLVGLLPMVL